MIPAGFLYYYHFYMIVYIIVYYLFVADKSGSSEMRICPPTLSVTSGETVHSG